MGALMGTVLLVLGGRAVMSMMLSENDESDAERDADDVDDSSIVIDTEAVVEDVDVGMSDVLDIVVVVSGIVL
jgi:hypothetical protein